jgi:uncharacterized protein
MPHFLAPLLRSPGCVHAVRNARTGAILVHALETAFDSSTRKRGLLGRDNMAAGTGMVIAPCSGVHTWFMRFAIDIVFVRRNGSVISVRRHVAPWRLAMSLQAFAVIELPAGSIDDTMLRAGDALQIVAA